MAMLSIQSPEQELSYILCKNPNNGMIAKKVKKGTLFGFYENPQKYNVVFFDGMDEISFKHNKYQEFEYLDSTRYHSPSFVTTALNTFFDTAMHGIDIDHVGEYSIKIEMIKIRKNKVFTFLRYFKDFECDIEPIINNIYSLKISTKTRTLKDLFQLCYLTAFFISIQNHDEVNNELNVIKKILKFCNDLNAPYFAKYLVKMSVIKNNNDFIKVKDLLEYSVDHTFKFTSFTNWGQRFEQIRNRINIEKDIVDFGCGEGSYLKLSEKVKNYYAIDKDENALEKVRKKIEKREYENVYVLNDIYDFLNEPHDEYNLIMTEVFEHNELDVITKIIKDILQDEKCYKIILTTPNKDFNQFYLLEDDEKRHPDHVFEMREQELIDYLNQLNVTYKIKHLGDEVDNISTSLLVEITK